MTDQERKAQAGQTGVPAPVPAPETERTAAAARAPERWPRLPLLTELDRPGRIGCSPPKPESPHVDAEAWFGEAIAAAERLPLPALSEPDAVRHFTALSARSHGVDSGFYPLGSCTMKYNPKVNDAMAALDGFARIHPLQPDEEVQGALRLLHDLGRMLCALAGMDAATLQPAAGAQGESTGLALIRAWHLSRGDAARTKILVPDSAHGTNPASAALAGFQVVAVPSGADGCVRLETVCSLIGPDTAGMMMTNPNTLGLFEPDILKICEAVHAAGGLMYYDGANLNAVMGRARPGDMGFDVAHLNLHKTFSTPHGGGGPGAGPVLVKQFLEPFLPVPALVRRDGLVVREWNRPDSIGQVKSFHGNFGVLVRAYAYLLAMGFDGLRQASGDAVLHANYLKARLSDAYEMPHEGPCMHEFVLSAARQAASGATALVLAKNLIDAGMHPPTIYFPLIVKEAMMVEPTETENLETLDRFAEEMLRLAAAASEDPASLLDAPRHMPVRRLDEVGAARNPVVCRCMVGE